MGWDEFKRLRLLTRRIAVRYSLIPKSVSKIYKNYNTNFAETPIDIVEFDKALRSALNIDPRTLDSEWIKRPLVNSSEDNPTTEGEQLAYYISKYPKLMLGYKDAVANRQVSGLARVAAETNQRMKAVDELAMSEEIEISAMTRDEFVELVAERETSIYGLENSNFCVADLDNRLKKWASVIKKA